MAWLSAAGSPGVVVCSDFFFSQQRGGQEVEESTTPALQLQHRWRRRRSAKYEPTTWDYNSICSLPPHTTHRDHDELLQQQARPLPLIGSQQQDDDANHLQPPLVATSDDDTISSLKDSVRRQLLVMLQEEEEADSDDGTRTRSSRLIRTIHQLQSLGIDDYHFHNEMRSILMSMHHHQQQQLLDLHSAALLFRMLRQLGIPASTDMLMSALREEEEGDKITDSDTLLALYQASYLAFPGETELDQVREFAVGKLLAAAGSRDHDSDLSGSHLHLSSSSLPLHWTAPRLQAMWSLKKKKRVAAVDPAILQLAQLDFNLVQALHRRELAEVTRWWKESRLGDLSFARDRVVECFFCAACIAPEPRLADCREVLAKTGALIVHLDDIYDVHGTMDELQAFTDAIARWEPAADDHLHLHLPEYMKAMYSAIWTTSVAAADRVLHKHGHDMLPLYKKAWHELCKAFLVEAQWQQQGHMPSFAEYVSNGWVTSTGPLLLLHALPAAAAAIPANGAAAAASIDYPKLVELSSTIFRLCNDCVSHEAESERGDAPSSIACCMAEPWCAGEEQARAAVQGVIAETWKALNWEVVVAASSSSAAPGTESSISMTTSTTMAANLCLNLARTIHCIYQDGDGITSPTTNRMKQMVKDLFFNPISIMHVSSS